MIIILITLETNVYLVISKYTYVFSDLLSNTFVKLYTNSLIYSCFFFVSNYIKISVDTLYDYPLRCFEIFHGISIKDEISRSNQHHRVSFLEINGTRYLRVVLAPLDGHENLGDFGPFQGPSRRSAR